MAAAGTIGLGSRQPPEAADSWALPGELAAAASVSTGAPAAAVVALVAASSPVPADGFSQYGVVARRTRVLAV